MSERNNPTEPLLASSLPITSSTYGAVSSSTDALPAERNDVEAAPRRLGKTMGAIEAFGILISIVIGSGIFTSPGTIDSNVPAPGVAVVVWLVGGLLAWTGASTIAELGTAIPGEGGVQPYLQFVYGKEVAFLAAWTWVFAIMPATLAILSIVFVDSISAAIGVPEPRTLGKFIHRKIISISILFLVSLLNCISTKASTRLNSFFVTTKFTAIIFIVVAGISVVAVQLSNDGDLIDRGGQDWYTHSWFAPRPSKLPDGSTVDWTSLSAWEIIGHLSTALYGALWAYSGWDKAVYVSEELKDPVRQLPLAINSALPTINLAFAAAIGSYYVLLPWDEIALTDSVAVTVITRLLGSTVGLVMSGLICLVVTGSLLGNSFVAARMAVAASNKEWLPTPLASVGHITIASHYIFSHFALPYPKYVAADPHSSEPQGDAPVLSILLAALIASVYILFGNFRQLVTFNGLAEYTFFFLTVLGVLILRKEAPDLVRPYKPPIWVPIIFALVSGFVVVRGALFEPKLAGLLAVVWAIGGLFWWGMREANTIGAVVANWWRIFWGQVHRLEA